ncbi:permease prefix domain 1-containing protein [Priestia megaterium]|uniref:permease prefix domain 1-containing protein n=1 Tax=Priestia megaterium TaxID=1404 RepID=UPI00272FDDC4|nr:permease prefix domain 1-containing protein [Priestia megaterium]MDP1383507.1 permease prefix domain 1-containing protein [Priestia megaterium]MDP1427657.1 permease prefix domain 1-containing protein [Priestia megaterium]
MKRIEKFVDSMYLNVEGDQQEINELKAEMTNHLLEAVHELKAQGKTEQQAITIAIKRFGEEKEIRAVIGQLFEIQKVFAKRVLYIAVVCLIVTMSSFYFLWKVEESTAQGISDTRSLISYELKDKDVITRDMKRKIEALVEDTNYVSGVTIYKSKNIISRSGENYVEYHWKSVQPDFQYQRTLWAPKWLGADFDTFGNGDEQWFVSIDNRSFSRLEVVVLFVGMAIYWTLFTIWAIINAYHQKRLRIGWVFMFVFFNIPGYLIYYFTGIQSRSSKEQEDLY